MKYYQIKHDRELTIYNNNYDYAYLNNNIKTIQFTNSGLYINFIFNEDICTLSLHKSDNLINRIHIKNTVDNRFLSLKIKMNQYGPFYGKTDYEISIIDNQPPSIFFTIAKNLINILNEFYKKLNEWSNLSSEEKSKLNYYW